MRILTVIRGAGLVLRTPDGVIEAEPFHPMRFAGDLAVDCSRIAGDVIDLNVIFDPVRIVARVMRLKGPEDWQASGPSAFLCLGGLVEADGQRLPEGAVALDPAALTLAPNGGGLLVTLDPI
jgi:environmental stress-induced protein Ves